MCMTLIVSVGSWCQKEANDGVQQAHLGCDGYTGEHGTHLHNSIFVRAPSELITCTVSLTKCIHAHRNNGYIQRSCESKTRTLTSVDTRRTDIHGAQPWVGPGLLLQFHVGVQW